MLVPYGFTAVKYCKLILSLCEYIHLGSENISPLEMLYNILSV